VAGMPHTRSLSSVGSWPRAPNVTCDSGESRHRTTTCCSARPERRPTVRRRQRCQSPPTAPSRRPSRPSRLRSRRRKGSPAWSSGKAMNSRPVESGVVQVHLSPGRKSRDPRPPGTVVTRSSSRSRHARRRSSHRKRPWACRTPRRNAARSECPRAERWPPSRRSSCVSRNCHAHRTPAEVRWRNERPHEVLQIGSTWRGDRVLANSLQVTTVWQPGPGVAPRLESLPWILAGLPSMTSPSLSAPGQSAAVPIVSALVALIVDEEQVVIAAVHLGPGEVQPGVVQRRHDEQSSGGVGREVLKAREGCPLREAQLDAVGGPHAREPCARARRTARRVFVALTVSLSTTAGGGDCEQCCYRKQSSATGCRTPSPATAFARCPTSAPLHP
jgi:hypothetical protein